MRYKYEYANAIPMYRFPRPAIRLISNVIEEDVKRPREEPAKLNQQSLLECLTTNIVCGGDEVEEYLHWLTT